MKSQQLVSLVYKFKILYTAFILPAAIFLRKDETPAVHWLTFLGLAVFIAAQVWMIKRKSAPVVAVSIVSGAVYIQSIVLMTGGYASPFLFLFIFTMMLYGFTEHCRWSYFTLLAYTPLLAFLIFRGLLERSWGGVILILAIWLLMLLIAVTVSKWEAHNSEQIYRLKEKARRDPLTGLFNRYILDEIYGLIESRNNDESCTMMMFDLDEFKQHNDFFGHPAGDQLLRRVSEVLTDSVRADDIIIRYGGDEFLIILWGFEKDRTEIILSRIRQRVLQETGCSISGGFAAGVILTRQNFEDLMIQADQDLYKRKGEKYILDGYLV